MQLHLLGPFPTVRPDEKPPRAAAIVKPEKGEQFRFKYAW